ncbi:uncharacterized protein TEOVI_000258700 [Trypanosoma equiperdum]|uniref:Uncharacterized protein n=1 Tax=Trypanosoma equiperdum TaxID=5694 RepID=A0A1G4IF42_TRYEQ|nr:hypothetical protein, conserved [Trypanosoma equiperdum]
MPRLHIWMLGATLAGCGQYVFCKHFYGDRYTEREEMESSIQAEKSYLLQLMQQYALLNRSIQDLPGSLCTTNRERLSVYCKIQQLREVIHNLPLKSMSAVDRKAMLLQLDGLEAAQCTPLNFRDEALTISEIVMCQFCYGFYMLCFCVIDPLLRRVAAERVRRQFLHRTSKMILHCLRIPVTMAFEPQAEYINDEKEGKLCCLVFSPQHWVEVVGFWACPLNPLLLSTHLQLWQLSLREVVPFSEYWHEQWCRMQRELVDAAVVSDPVVEYSGGRILQPTDSINAVKGSDSPVTSTYGYPRALRRGYEGSPVLDPEMKNLTGVHPSSAASAAGPRFVPVASCGLPRLLYINEAVARPDVRPRPTQKEIYTQLQHLQYPESLGCSSGVRKINASGGNAKDCNLKAEKEGELLLQLRSWYSCGGIPWWHRATWGAAYGGVGRRGNCDWRGLSFRLGRPCSADQLLKEQMGLCLCLHTPTNVL